jgi:hypothetical protein
MKMLHKLFPLGHCLISLLFICCGLALIIFARLQLWDGIQPWGGLALNQRLHTVLDSIAVLTAAVAALELGQTILQEEAQREAQMSAPTRVRRFLSRFIIVLVVSLSIEALVAVFQFTHAHPERLPYAATIGLMAAALLAAWGLFIVSDWEGQNPRLYRASGFRLLSLQASTLAPARWASGLSNDAAPGDCAPSTSRANSVRTRASPWPENRRKPRCSLKSANTSSMVCTRNR